MSNHIYKIIKNETQLDKLISYCKQTHWCSWDIETNGEPFHKSSAFITMMSVSFQPGSSYIIPLGHNESKFRDNWLPIFTKFGEEVLEDFSIDKVAFNAKFEEKWCYKYGIKPNGRIFDPMLEKYFLDEERPNDLGSLVNRFIPGFQDYKDDTQKLATKYGWANIPFDELSKRNALDSDLTLRLHLFFTLRLIKAGLYPLYRNMGMMQHKVLSESEFLGMKVNASYLKNLIRKQSILITNKERELYSSKKVLKFQNAKKQEKIEKLINETKNEIDELIEQGFSNSDRRVKGREEKVSRYIAGDFKTKNELKVIEDVNFNAPKQMAELLFDSKFGFRFKPTKKTDSGEWSTDESVLLQLKLKDKTGFISNLLDHREMQKLYSTYMVGMREHLSENNRVHASYLIHGTVTGRLSSREPNFQNIPRDITASQIKTMFIPDDKYLLLELDYSQAELRIVAELADETAMIEIFKSGKNIHVATACNMYKCPEKYDYVYKTILKDVNHPENDEWEKRKKIAKTVNFAILYGQTKKALSEGFIAKGLNITEEQAQKFIDDWFKAFPRIKKWMVNQLKSARQNGYVLNPFGRKRRLPQLYDDNEWKRREAERQAINSPIQGGASDFTQFASILIREERLAGRLPKYFKQYYTVHDSLGYPIKPEDIHNIVPRLIELCANPQTKRWFNFQFEKVFMKMSPEIGIHWAELREYDPKIDYTQLLK